MHLWTIFSLIILLAMVNEIIGGKRDDKIARDYQFSTGHSSKGSFERKVDNAVEGAKDLAKKIPKAAKKKVVSMAKGFGKAVEQVVTKRGGWNIKDKTPFTRL